MTNPSETAPATIGRSAVACVALLAMATSAGCHRRFFLRTADRDTYGIISQKAAGPTWAVQPGFTINPDPRSRFYTPTSPVDPELPIPAPQLYQYELPSLVTPAPDPRELQADEAEDSEAAVTEESAGSGPSHKAASQKDAFQPNAFQPNSSIQGSHRDNASGQPAKTSGRVAELAPPAQANALPDAGVRASGPRSSRRRPAPPNPEPIAATTNSAQSSSATSLRFPAKNATRVSVDDPVVLATASATPVVRSAAELPLTAPGFEQERVNQQPDEASEEPSDTAVVEGGASQDLNDSDPEPGRPEEVEAEEVEAGDIVSLSSDPQLALELPPLPASAWRALPAKCLRRMLEFEEVRTEYERTFGEPVQESQLDSAPRVNLQNILELALINNRVYQTRKEILYRTALRLTLERFDFDLRFFGRGNGTNVDYFHNRDGGIEVNTLGVPTTYGLTKSLYTAGDLVARFANDVVLTFNGTNGYSSNVSSRLILDLSQPLIQRDIRFESLTQSERDVVYAARDFVRFRKLLFRDLANQYYSLLLTYRRIAINTQDYFSNLDGFNRAQAVYAVGRLPSFQVDQFEQNVLGSRGRLINSCNALEEALDSFKLQIGLPVEMPFNVDLSELESLTLSDEATVIREQIRRKRLGVIQRLEDELAPLAAIPLAEELARRMLDLIETRVRLDLSEPSETQDLKLLVAQMRVQSKRIEVQENDAVLQEGQAGEARILPAQVLLRLRAVLEFQLDAIELELQLLELAARRAETESDDESMNRDAGGNRPAEARLGPADDLAAALKSVVNRAQQVLDDYSGLPNEQKAERIPEVIEAIQGLLEESREIERELARRLESFGLELLMSDDTMVQLARSVVDRSSTGIFAEDTSLTELEVDYDEAVLTALVQRLDLMNRRGELADARRQIKLAADDLKSILNVQATQVIGTPRNKPFDFGFDDSSTRLRLEFDTPLNRRAERNSFRSALINYNLALRNLIQAEDEVKLQIRNDLRAIELDQNQYEIAVASAALAYERVTSTRLQYAVGQGNVNARDFLEAQQDYTASLSAVAEQHIGYVQDRIRFFLNLEQLQVDRLNFWPELRNEDYPFVANTDFPGTSPYPYGLLPPGPWFSKHMRRIQSVPPGHAAIHRSLEAEEGMGPQDEKDTDRNGQEDEESPLNEEELPGLPPT